MAYIPQTQLPEKEQNLFGRKDETTPAPIPPQTGGSAGTGTEGMGGKAAPGVGTSTQFGSNAAKLSDYLKANAPQVAQFGQQVAGNLTKGYNEAMSNINQGAQQFAPQIQGGFERPNQDFLNQAFQNPTEFVKNPQNVSQFQKFYSNQYTGPQNFEGSDIYSNINKQVGQATENAGLVNSFPGLQTYLRNFMNTGQNTPGMQTLDTALLQRNPEAAQSIREAAAPYSGLKDYLAGTTQQTNADIQKAVQEAQSSAQNVQGQFQNAANQFTQGIEGQIPGLQSQAQARDAAFRAAAQQGNALTPQEQQLYGATNWDQILQGRQALSQQPPAISGLGDLYGQQFDLSPYMTDMNPQGLFTKETVATPEQYAQEAALQQLSGNRFNVLPEDISAAGTAPQTLTRFNAPGALSGVQGTLRNQDTQFMQRQNIIPAGGGGLGSKTEGEWVNFFTDPKVAEAYQNGINLMRQISGRNSDLVPDTMLSQANTMQGYIDQAKSLPTGTGGTETGPTDTGGIGGGETGGTPDTGGNLRIINNQQMWYNGSEWVPAPKEFITNPDGSTSQFDYATGQYNQIQTPHRPSMGFSGGGGGLV